MADKSRPRARLLIIHPTIEPAEITRALGIDPDHASRFGEPRKTPVGTPLPGTYRDTRWTLAFPNLRETTLSAVVAEALAVLPANSVFWAALKKAGGKAHLILVVVGDHYQGASLDTSQIQHLAKMGISLGIEVYAVPQN